MRKTRIRTIATEYKGTTFRSRTEARFARWCDSWRIKWLYEPEGFAVGNTCYLPDFYLPEGRIVVEIKPPVFMDEAWKIRALADAIPEAERRGYGSVSMWCGSMHGDFFRAAMTWKGSGWEDAPWNYSGWEHPEDGLWAVRCVKCDRPHFVSPLSAYWCPWCGAYEGDHYLDYFPGIPECDVPPGPELSVFCHELAGRSGTH